jgi:hypothetical protein
METEKVEPDGEQAPATPSAPALVELGERLATDIKAHVDESLASLRKSNSRNQWLLSILVPVLSAVAAGVVTYVNNQSVEKIRTEYAQTREFYTKQIDVLANGFALVAELQSTGNTAIKAPDPQTRTTFSEGLQAVSEWQAKYEFYLAEPTVTSCRAALLKGYQILQSLEGARPHTPSAATTWQTAVQAAKRSLVDEARNPGRYLGAQP